ncbi:MAG TPA: ABC transporter substrate-binding protein [Acidimicrobiales bacterium]|nr:ABC transporter substrate-binding protein [Acidimicrobiales bacterium]
MSTDLHPASPASRRGAKRRWRALALAPLLATGLAACGSSSTSSSSATTAKTASGATSATSTAGPPVAMNLEIYLGSYYTWLPYLAEAQGFFTKNNINANIIGLTSGGSVAFAALANGSADVAMGDLSLSGPLLEKGVGLTDISGAVHAGWQLVAPKGSPLPTTFPASVKALKGKTIGVVGLGTSSYYFAQQLVAAAGLGPNDVQYAALGGVVANAVSALQANRVAAAMVSPDAAYYLEHGQGDQLVFDTSSNAALTSAGGLLGSIAGTDLGGMWARNGWLSAHPGVAKQFQLAMDEADVWMHNPANLQTVIADLQKENDLASFEQGPGGAAFFTYALPQIISYAAPGSGEAGMTFWNKAGLLPKVIPTSQWYSSTIPTSASQVVAAVDAAGESSLGSNA